MEEIKRLIIIITLIIIFIMIVIQNRNLQVTKLDFESQKLPLEFDGFVICHISDFHNTKFGDNQNVILKKIKQNNPNIIVITGDLIDRRKFNLELAMEFINGAMEISPVYYVSGNHEARSNKYQTIKNELVNAGVTVLDNEMVSVIKQDSSIDIYGLSDPDFFTSDYINETNISQLKEKLEEWSSNKNFKILLSHRPELFDLYSENNMDLIFSGHAHGGQFRLPFIGGLVAPNQGIFPKYTSGFYTNKNSTMFVSRGIGNSIIPLRIFNRPEIAIITLYQQK